jgi:integrase
MTRRKRMNGEGSIRKRPDGRFEARVLLSDGRRISIYGKTAREVSREIRAIKVKQDSGESIIRHEERLGTFLEIWLDTEIKRRRRAKTYASYTQMVHSHILRELGSVKLTELSARRVQAWLDAKEDTGLSARTVRYMRDILRSALQHAWRNDLVIENVAKKVTVPELAKKEIVPLTQSQAMSLLGVLGTNRLLAFYSVAIALGLRPAEGIGLRWSDVDLEQRRLSVRQTIQRVRTNPDAPLGKRSEVLVDETKSDAGARIIDLPDSLVTRLRAHKALQAQERLATDSWQDYGLVFTTLLGTPVEERRLVRIFKEALFAAGLPGTIRLYDCRHTAASLLYAQGVPELQITAILGHTDPAFTRRTYTHLFPEMRRSAADSMESAVGNAL